MKPVILYAVTGCPLCARYRALFDERGQTYEERNVTENPAYREEVNKLGTMVMPVVVVGERAIPGFRPNTVIELLNA